VLYGSHALASETVLTIGAFESRFAPGGYLQTSAATGTTKLSNPEWHSNISAKLEHNERNACGQQRSHPDGANQQRGSAPRTHLFEQPQLVLTLSASFGIDQSDSDEAFEFTHKAVYSHLGRPVWGILRSKTRRLTNSAWCVLALPGYLSVDARTRAVCAAVHHLDVHTFELLDSSPYAAERPDV
jgi:hypothetical protein